jgi:L-lactate dehydrogenase complex protein LldE
MRVQLFGTCLVDTFFPETGTATLKLLDHLGVEVTFPRGQTCCGKPSDSAGYREQTKQAARHFLRTFSGPEPIVVPSGSCASMIKNHYPRLFEDDPSLRCRAEETAQRTFELTQFLVNVLHAHTRGFRGSGRITYHASCQLTRELGVREEPLLLLGSLSGAEFVPLPTAGRCCGFGGTFMMKLPEVSRAMSDDKAADIITTGADTVTGCDHGCLMNISHALKARGSSVAVKHIAQVLAEGL